MSCNRRLRVLCLPTGPDEYAVAIIRALTHEVDVDVIMPTSMLERYKSDLPATVQVHPLEWPRHRDPRNVMLLVAIARIVRQIRPDVIHFLGDSVVWLTLLLPIIWRRRLVVTVHDVHYHPGDLESLIVPMVLVRLLRRTADAIIVHGENLKADLAATGISPPQGIHVVSHPVLDRQVRSAQRALPIQKPTHRPPNVLFVGRIMAYKGLGLLIEASDWVRRIHPTARFVVAGRGPDLVTWRNALAERPWFEVRDRYVHDNELAQLLLNADLLVLPYIEASQSGILALAAGAGLPVVATAVGEIGPLVRRNSGNGEGCPSERLRAGRCNH